MRCISEHTRKCAHLIIKNEHFRCANVQWSNKTAANPFTTGNGAQILQQTTETSGFLGENNLAEARINLNTVLLKQRLDFHILGIAVPVAIIQKNSRTVIRSNHVNKILNRLQRINNILALQRTKNITSFLVLAYNSEVLAGFFDMVHPVNELVNLANCRIIPARHNSPLTHANATKFISISGNTNMSLSI